MGFPAVYGDGDGDGDGDGVGVGVGVGFAVRRRQQLLQKHQSKHNLIKTFKPNT